MYFRDKSSRVHHVPIHGGSQEDIEAEERYEVKLSIEQISKDVHVHVSMREDNTMGPYNILFSFNLFEFILYEVDSVTEKNSELVKAFARLMKAYAKVVYVTSEVLDADGSGVLYEKEIDNE